MSVKVAVRVRPFNTREKDLDCRLCVDMNGPVTTITNPTDGKVREFAFDYSFWSHDGYEELEDGYFQPTSDRYADQNKIFSLIGKEVLDNAWEGYHCCLFAYGQTGAGKSYSTVGYGANKGIVPIAMADIFDRIATNTNPEVSFQVNFSMLEIYNEKIQDLLVPVKERPKTGLKVREHKKIGVYVEGQSKHPVDTYKAIAAKMEEGSKNRSIGATLMNASSSRAHTVMTIEFKRIEMIEHKKTERFSVIHLVDLAGSEKISKSGVKGDRLKEGCAINKSLLMLGFVISKLAEKSTSKKNVVVPYRDSSLTRILQNALGGNSKTLMICAISPATDNYEETLSTLRYADQAKKIKNNAVINVSEQGKTIRELMEENERLKELLKNIRLSEIKDKPMTVEEEDMKRKYVEMEEQIRANIFLIINLEQNYEIRLAEAKAKAEEKALEIEEDQIDFTKPYLMNLNEDPLLSGKILHSLDRELVRIGKKNGDPLPEIILGGVSIQPNHAEIRNNEGKITLVPMNVECGEQLFVNGQKVLEEVELFHNDRIIIGTNAIFLMKYPGKEEVSPNAQKVKDSDLDWEFAQTELIDMVDQERKQRMEELEIIRRREVEEKIQSIEEKFQQEQKENKSKMKKQKKEHEQKIKELGDSMKKLIVNQGFMLAKVLKDSEQQKLEIEKREAEKGWKEKLAQYEDERLRKEREREKMQRDVLEEAARKKFKDQEKIRIEAKLAKHYLHIMEANLIAKELHRTISFSVKIIYNYVSGAELQLYGEEKMIKTKIRILVHNKETTSQYMWSLGKFMNRFFMIKDVYDQQFDGTKPPEKNTAEDPFWDPPEPRLIGQAFLALDPLGYLLDSPNSLTLVGENGPIGKLNVNVIPLNEKGEEINEDTEMIDDPVQLLKRRLDFVVHIDTAELPANFCQDNFCTYSLMNEQHKFETFTTLIVPGDRQEPEFNYRGHHTYSSVDEKILNFIMNHNLKIQLYGYDIPDNLTRISRGMNSLLNKSSRIHNHNQEFADNAMNKEELKMLMNEDPITKYRKTIFAPGAAVNRKKHEGVTLKRCVTSPEVEGSNDEQSKSPIKPKKQNSQDESNASKSPEVDSSSPEQSKSPKKKSRRHSKEECNIF